MSLPCPSCGAPVEPTAAFCPSCGAARAAGGTPAHPDPIIGRTIIGQYVIKERLGEGGMGAVYLADQPSVGREAVVKVMHPGVSQDPSVAPRFQVEARAASQLNHPHIITIYNHGAMEDGALFLAMEYCRGGSLEQAVRQGPLRWQRALDITHQIADALAEAHGRGVVHRDLKPSNIMLMEVGRQRDYVKVLDFGIAKIEGVKMTRTGSVIGTPQYMSPEQLRGESPDGRADLYSLGVMLYEMVAGQLPFKSDSVAGYMHKHLNETPTSPVKVKPGIGIPRALESLILRALAKRREERFQSAEELMTALDTCRSAPDKPLGRARRGVGLWIALGASLIVAAGTTVALATILSRGAPHGGNAPAAEDKAVWRVVFEQDARPPALPERSDEVVERELDASAPAPRVVRRGPGRARRAASRARGRGPIVRRNSPDSARGVTGPEPPQPDTPGKARVALAMSKGPAEDKEDGSKAVRPAMATSGTAGTGGTKYDKMSAAQLERALRRLMKNAKMPPSSAARALASYHQARKSYPADRKEKLSRRYLLPLIKVYCKPSLQFGPHERKPLAQLRRIFVTMKTRNNLSVERRRAMMDHALATYDTGAYKNQDRPFYKRVELLRLIRSHAADPRQVLR